MSVLVGVRLAVGDAVAVRVCDGCGVAVAVVVGEKVGLGVWLLVRLGGKVGEKKIAFTGSTEVTIQALIRRIAITRLASQKPITKCFNFWVCTLFSIRSAAPQPVKPQVDRPAR